MQGICEGSRLEAPRETGRVDSIFPSDVGRECERMSGHVGVGSHCVPTARNAQGLLPATQARCDPCD
jgi:hypothetical protein